MIESIRLDDLEEAHLLRLIENGVTESATLEYKRELYGPRDKDKKEFLKDVCAFANAHGGSIIIGVEENNGLPTKLCGIAGISADEVIRRFDSLLRDALQPRLIRVEWRAIQLGNGHTVIVLRVPRSLNAPHRVGFQGWNKFFVRNAAGVHEVSVEELRDLFLSAQHLEDRVRAFRADRIMRLKAGETPRPTSLLPGVVLHITPLSALTAGSAVDVVAAYEKPECFIPLGATGFDQHLNFDGMLTTTGDGTSRRPTPAYCQLFRNGCVEAVRSYQSDSGPAPLNIQRIEELLVKRTRGIVSGLVALGLSPPFVVMPSLLGVRDVSIIYGPSKFERPPPFDRDDLILPEVVLQDVSFQTGWADGFRTTFDVIWQGVGIRGSPGFDKEGAWRGDQ